MRCIEIPLQHFGQNTHVGLIETWDVLKLQGRTIAFGTNKINRNMRCIEIADGKVTAIVKEGD